MIGKTISHYKILSKLGEGGMGVVYEAEDTKLDRTVALKFLPPQALENEKEKTRFIHEAKAAAALHHPNICTVYEIGESDDGRTFIAMAHLPGRSLKEKITEGPLELADAVDTAIQICAGLHEAHTRGIVHRDIKPANIMIGDTGQVAVMDFGLAKKTGATRLTSTGTTVGTVAYMSPEQLQADPVDERTDVWSLGTVLYEMLTGRLPFEGDVEPALIYSIINREPDSLASHRADAPPGLDGIIAKALAKDPRRRYQGMNDLASDLKELRADRKAIPAGALTWRQRRRRKRQAVFGIAALLVVLLGATALWVAPTLLGESQTIRSLAVLPLENLSGDPDQDLYAEGLTVELISTFGKIQNLRVTGRRSAMKYKDSDKTVQEIASELGVDGLMEGSIQLVGDEIHIAVELVHATTDEILWSDSFDGGIGDVLDIQRRIALAVAKGINAKLTPELREELAPPVNQQAYEEYLKFRLAMLDSAGLDHLERAVELDSTFAAAWASLSWRTAYSARYGRLPRGDGYRRARRAAQKALELDESASQAHLALIWVHWDQDWDWSAAQRELRHTLELNPSDEGGLSAKTEYLMMKGRIDEGVAVMKALIEKDPLNVGLRWQLGFKLMISRQYDAAIAQFKETLELFPDNLWSKTLLGWTYSYTGRHEDAVAIYKELERGPGWGRGSPWNVVTSYANSSFRGEVVEALERARADYEKEPSGRGAWLVAYFLAPLGEKAEALEWLEKSAAAFRRDVTEGNPRADRQASDQASLYAWVGDKEKAFEWFDLAFELRAPQLAYMHRFVPLDGLRDDPRFDDLLRRRGYPKDVIRNLSWVRQK